MVEDEMTLVIIHQDYACGVSGAFAGLFSTAVVCYLSIAK